MHMGTGDRFWTLLAFRHSTVNDLDQPKAANCDKAVIGYSWPICDCR